MNKAKSDELGLALVELMQEALQDSARWFPNTQSDMYYYALALGGETGEFQNIVKKIMRGDLDIRDANVRYQLMMEWTDILVYMLLVGGLLKINPIQAYNHVRGLNEQRFGNGN